MDEIKRALLGDREAAKRLTDAGVLIPCHRCGGKAKLAERDREIPFSEVMNEFCVVCPSCGFHSDFFGEVNLYYKPNGKDLAEGYKREARLLWNTRAPILSAKEMEMLERMK